jgi:hypothetical protein
MTKRQQLYPLEVDAPSELATLPPDDVVTARN